MSGPTRDQTDSNVRRLVVLGYTLLLAFASLWPRPPELPHGVEIPHADKVVHALLYSVYAWIILWAAPRRRSRPFAVAIVIYTTAFGALMEILQGTVIGPVRTGSLGDAIANAAGSVAGAAACLATFTRRMSSHPG